MSDDKSGLTDAERLLIETTWIAVMALLKRDTDIEDLYANYLYERMDTVMGLYQDERTAQSRTSSKE